MSCLLNISLHNLISLTFNFLCCKSTLTILFTGMNDQGENLYNAYLVPTLQYFTLLNQDKSPRW